MLQPLLLAMKATTNSAYSGSIVGVLDQENFTDERKAKLRSVPWPSSLRLMMIDFQS